MKKILITLLCLLPACAGLDLTQIVGVGTSKMKLIVPLYDLSYASKVYQAANNGTLLVVILNPNEGAGKSKDGQWVSAINKLGGAEKYGYVDMVTWKGDKATLRSKDDLNKEIENWRNWYGVTKFFFDDWNEKCSMPQSVTCIANPGFDLKTPANFTVVWETEKYTKSKPSKLNNSVVFAMGESDYKSALKLAKERGVSMFYAVEASDTWAAYDKLPSYFLEMAKDIK